MNFKWILCGFCLVLNGGFAMAQSLPSNSNTVLFECDTGINSITSNCSDVSQQHFLQVGQLLGNNPNPECNKSPNDLCCGLNNSSGTEAKFLVVYPINGTVDCWRVIKNITGVNIQALSTAGSID